MAGNETTKKGGRRGAGRKEKTSEVAEARLEKLFTKHDLKGRRRQELMSVVCELFCKGYTRSEIVKRVGELYSNSYAPLLRGENLWDLLREAARRQLLTHTPCDDSEFKQKLLADYRWLQEHLVVAQTGSTDALAQKAADKLLDMIRNVRRQQKCDTVHVGFAGGMTLRSVAEKLSQLLHQPDADNPKTLVFHAMVASFDDDDFYADPNSFITYFIGPECRVNVRLVRLPMPGIVESKYYPQIRKLAGIDRVFERRREIQIIVTSGSLWSDEQSTLRTYMKAAMNEALRKSPTAQGDGTSPEEAMREYDQQGVVGDLLWQPINRQGPVQIESGYQVTTLMGLDELPDFIADGGSVLLVMGCSGLSRRPKSEVLQAILDLHPEHKWVTDVVTDSPTVEGLYLLGTGYTPDQQSGAPRPK